MNLQHITIIGLGLMGGSLAKALKKSQPKLRISAYVRSNDALQKALKSGAIDDGSTNITEAVKDSDAIIFCTPLSSYSDLLQEALPHLKEGVIISDIGSAKQYVIDVFTPLLSIEQQKRFIPAHPIAGAEKDGFSASKPTLFKEKRLIITPTGQTSRTTVDAITKLWKLTGAYTEELSAKRHDAIYATVSHAPQFLAFAYGDALVALPDDVQKCIDDERNEAFDRFRRIGNSPTAMWDDIFSANAIALSHALDKTIDALTLSMHHLKDRPQDFARNHASLNVLEHSTKLEKIPHEAFIYLHVLPVMLARALHSVAELHLPYTGTGFADFASMWQIPLPPKEIMNLQAKTLAAAEQLISIIHARKATL